MLAYELFLKNKDYAGEFVKNVKPVKKVFVKNDKVSLDKKTLSEYGITTREEFKIFQELLSMPLNTSDNLFIPNKATGTNSPKPYVEIYGRLDNKKTKKSISLSVKDKSNTFSAILDLEAKSQTISSSGSLKLNLDRKNYSISGKNLFDEYVKSGVVDKNGNFSSALFKEICTSKDSL